MPKSTRTPAPKAKIAVRPTVRQQIDDRLHEALMQSFDCGDPVAISITR